MKVLVCIYSLFFIVGFGFSQQNSLLIHTFFKDRLFENSDSSFYLSSSFLPVFESEYNLNEHIRDSSIQYYNLTETLFKKHLFEAKGSNFYITISPVIDFSIGKDLNDTNERRLFQNTRGFFIEGDLLNNFSFSTTFFENQGRFANYESAYYSSIGELYPNQSNGIYTTQNAVIPGGGRTKAFKGDGFDYAYAVGNIVYSPNRSIILSAGNTSQFIGDGYRSILLSDNSIPAPFLRATFKISNKWEFNYLRTKLINLIRKPVSSSVEAYYETKALSVNYLTFKPTNKFAISLFEGVIWSKGDSITSKKVNPLFYNPVPIITEVSISEKEIYSVIGLNLGYAPFRGHRFYGQLAIGDLNSKQIAYQIGYRGYNYFNLKNFMLQLEYNNVSKDMYSASNSRLNFSHYNLPLAHIKGNSFQEFILRSNFEWKRIYVDFKSVFYLVKDYSPLDLLPVEKNVVLVTGNISIQKLEFGYRFNKKMNLTLFTSLQYRTESLNTNNTSNQIFFGLRTGINNHYNDF